MNERVHLMACRVPAECQRTLRNCTAGSTTAQQSLVVKTGPAQEAMNAWHGHTMCLLSTLQRSTPGSPRGFILFLPTVVLLLLLYHDDLLQTRVRLLLGFSIHPPEPGCGTPTSQRQHLPRTVRITPLQHGNMEQLRTGCATKDRPAEAVRPRTQGCDCLGADQLAYNLHNSECDGRQQRH